MAAVRILRLEITRELEQVTNESAPDLKERPDNLRPHPHHSTTEVARFLLVRESQDVVGVLRILLVKNLHCNS